MYPDFNSQHDILREGVSPMHAGAEFIKTYDMSAHLVQDFDNVKTAVGDILARAMNLVLPFSVLCPCEWVDCVLQWNAGIRVGGDKSTDMKNQLDQEIRLIQQLLDDAEGNHTAEIRSRVRKVHSRAKKTNQVLDTVAHALIWYSGAVPLPTRTLSPKESAEKLADVMVNLLFVEKYNMFKNVNNFGVKRNVSDGLHKPLPVARHAHAYHRLLLRMANPDQYWVFNRSLTAGGALCFR